MAEFSGFPAETKDFLFALQFENTLERLPANKAQYARLVRAPVTELYHALLPAARAVSRSIDTRPARCIASMYADRRFSPGAPLKGYTYLRFREEGRQADILGLYFDMGCDHYSYGLRVYKQTAGGMESIRADVLRRQKAYAAQLEKLLAAGAKLIGKDYARDHYSQLQAGPAKTLLNKRDFYLGWNRAVRPEAIGPPLADELARAFAEVAGLYGLLKAAVDAPQGL